MGKIKMQGIARKTIEADKTEYNVSFSSVNISLEDATKRVSDNVKSFLQGLVKLGFEMKEIHVSDSSTSNVTISQKSFRKAYRSMTFTTQFNPALQNRIFDIIGLYKSDASISVDHKYSKEDETYNDLLIEAVKDSKKKAALIAGVNDEQIRAIEYVSDDYYDGEECIEPEIMYKMAAGAAPVKRLSDQLGAPVKEIDREIYVTWEIA